MTEKPQAKPVDIGYLPDTLCKTAKFCNWRYEWVDDRWTKVPCSPGTGRHIDATDPVVYETLDDALETKHEHDGIGVGIFDNLAGIDIDHCVDEDGHLSELAQDIVDTMDAYTEKSPSGTGLRILFTVPDGFDYAAKTEYYVNNRKNGVEVYVAGKTERFLTVTGDTLTEGRDLRERGDQLHVVLDKYMKKAQPKQDPPADTSAQPVDVSDEDLYNLMIEDEKTFLLFNGDWSAYNSQSEADLALCCKLAFWTGRDPERIDRFFRMSGLYRDKWDRDDYRTATIDKAIAGTTDVYNPGGQDKPPKKQGPRLKGLNVAKYILTGGMEDDVVYFGRYAGRGTGFRNLDKHLTLYPGLAALGGAASLGKSTFLVNLADNLIAQGETVLFFTLEQTVIEIVTKSLARRLAERHPGTHLDNLKIKNGDTDDQLEQVKKEYAEAVADKFYIIPCDFRTTAAAIREMVELFIRDRGVRPVVMIDYLQLVSPPEDFRGDQRAALDHNIKLFKTMQLQNELLVIVVSNFNRSGYDTPVSYEDFKESSLIEFTCDYIWGLQLSILSETRFYYTLGSKGGKNKTTEIDRDNMIAEAAQEYPKRVQFVSLKNRNGKQRFSGNFEYYNNFDYFRDTDSPLNPFEDPTTPAKGPDIDFK